MKYSKELKEGYNASYFGGLAPEANPYPKTSKEHGQWLEGYLQAEKEAFKESTEQ